jgi:hypothetical protein
LSRDLYLDAADRAELLVAVELAFRINISSREAAAISTVRKLIAVVERKTPVDESSIHADEALIEAIEDLAVGAASAREAIDVSAAALVLVQRHPQTSLTPEDIHQRIERAAVAAGADILPGNQRRYS